MSATLAKERAEAVAAAAAAARAAAVSNGATVQRRPPDQDDVAVQRAVLTAKVAQALKEVHCWFLSARMKLHAFKATCKLAYSVFRCSIVT